MVPSVMAGLRARTLRGFMLLAAQRVVGLLISVVGGIMLARLLMPEVFGVYAIIGFAVGLGVTFGDLGLGSALVQRRDLDPAASLGVAFTAHIVLALGMGAAIVGLAPALVDWLGLAPDAVEPLRCLALLVPLSAFRMPAVVLLERNLDYLSLTVADTLDTVLFHAVTIVAALAGMGVWSFVLGAVLARLSGLTVIWRSSRWRPVLRWRWADLAPVLRFGTAFQGAALLTLVRDAVVPTYVAALSGVSAVGFLNWAAALAFLPLQVVSIAGKVLFPTLSQLRDDPPRFAVATERALNRVALILYPAALLLLTGAPPIVRLVFGDPWVPAVPALRLFCLTAIIGGTSNILIHALYCLGRADFVFRLNLLWTVLLWGLALLLVPWLGFVGFAAASACLSTTGVLTAMALRRVVPVRVFPHVRIPLVAGLASALLFEVLATYWVHDILSLVISGCAAVSAYAGLVCRISDRVWRADILADWQKLWAVRS